jgi:predicted RNA-binding Zn-ribbon protein involved in translation (DUF1610 family)
MAVMAQTEQEFCPDCGNFVDALNETTGFCYDCTPLSQQTPQPEASRIERWLMKYADTIEFVMQKEQTTAKLAILEVHATYRATCIICNRQIRHGTHGRHFICNSTPACKKARRRYKYLIYDKGFTKEEATAAILTPQEG